jgi:hypothetical protein
MSVSLSRTLKKLEVKYQVQKRRTYKGSKYSVRGLAACATVYERGYPINTIMSGIQMKKMFDRSGYHADSV